MFFIAHIGFGLPTAPSTFSSWNLSRTHTLIQTLFAKGGGGYNRILPCLDMSSGSRQGGVTIGQFYLYQNGGQKTATSSFINQDSKLGHQQRAIPNCIHLLYATNATNPSLSLCKRTFVQSSFRYSSPAPSNGSLSNQQNTQQATSRRRREQNSWCNKTTRSSAQTISLSEGGSYHIAHARACI